MSYPVYTQNGFVAGSEGVEPCMQVVSAAQEPSPDTHRTVFVSDGSGATEIVYATR